MHSCTWNCRRITFSTCSSTAAARRQLLGLEKRIWANVASMWAVATTCSRAHLRSLSTHYSWIKQVLCRAGMQLLMGRGCSWRRQPGQDVPCLLLPASADSMSSS